MDSRYLSAQELNAKALEQFIYQPVSRDMITYLALAAHKVIACDSTLMPPGGAQQDLPPTPPKSPEPRAVKTDDSLLPSLEEFITQLVVSSNVQVPTLMSTLVYLTRLKSKLQPMARGLRCTTHRIFLASLILSAKYLNDSSPKNKHWANYSHIKNDFHSFGFNRTEVNLMEKQLLFLLEWDLRISEQDLYRELDAFLEPLRVRIAERHNRKMRQREERKVYRELLAQATRYPSPASSRGHSRSRQPSPEQLSATSGDSTPPGLAYSSSASSYTPSIASSRHPSRSNTPLERESEATSDPYMYGNSQHGSLYDSPVQVVLDTEATKDHMSAGRMLPYEISAEQYQQLQDGAPKRRHRRGMWERLLGGTVAAR